MKLLGTPTFSYRSYSYYRDRFRHVARINLALPVSQNNKRSISRQLSPTQPVDDLRSLIGLAIVNGSTEGVYVPLRR